MISRQIQSAANNANNIGQVDPSALSALAVPNVAFTFAPVPKQTQTVEQRAAEIEKIGIAKVFVDSSGKLSEFDTKAVAIYLKKEFKLETVECDGAGKIQVSPKDCKEFGKILDKIQLDICSMKGWEQDRNYIGGARIDLFSAKSAEKEVVVTNEDFQWMAFRSKKIDMGQKKSDYVDILEIREKQEKKD